ncbi:hypothetical protein EJB05_53813 [Eragrostis curvula]|uniref:Uncharacterized protein n=1 Tax=Eragrostis curvula TaxID=38414 RepID=A0A5J9SP52_9POAL|nr:hypothetical protein EJB05_53813 [Eragrostis curvula]
MALAASTPAVRQRRTSFRWRGHDELTGDGFDQPVSRIPGESSVIARVQCNMDKMNAQVIKFLEAHAMRFFHDWVPGCSNRAGKHKQRGSSRLSGCMGRIVTCLLDCRMRGTQRIGAGHSSISDHSYSSSRTKGSDAVHLNAALHDARLVSPLCVYHDSSRW